MISPESGSSPLYTAVYTSDMAVYPRNVYFQPKDLYHSSHDHRNPKIPHMLLDLLVLDLHVIEIRTIDFWCGI